MFFVCLQKNMASFQSAFSKNGVKQEQQVMMFQKKYDADEARAVMSHTFEKEFNAFKTLFGKNFPTCNLNNAAKTCFFTIYPWWSFFYSFLGVVNQYEATGGKLVEAIQNHRTLYCNRFEMARDPFVQALVEGDQVVHDFFFEQDAIPDWLYERTLKDVFFNVCLFYMTNTRLSLLISKAEINDMIQYRRQ